MKSVFFWAFKKNLQKVEKWAVAKELKRKIPHAQIKNQISTKSDSVKAFHGLKSAEEFFVPIELLKSSQRKYKI